MPISTRIALAYLALTGLAVGVWAYGFPASFYGSFPGFRRTWVCVDGPFNEHLVRDTGAAYLMMGTIGGLGLLRPLLVAPFAVGLSTLLFNLPHFAYHMTHLGLYGRVDQILNIVALLSAVLCSLWLMTSQAVSRP